MVPTSMVGKLSFYTDTFGFVQPFLGPAGWKCSVLDAADGSYGITLTSPYHTSEVIGASSNGPCVSCMFNVACPWLAPAVRASFGLPCFSTPPKGQVSKVLAMSFDTREATVFVTLRPGSRGTITPGPAPNPVYTTQGLIVYNLTKNPYNYAFTLGCALPTSEQDVCTLVENRFLTSRWGVLR